MISPADLDRFRTLAASLTGHVYSERATPTLSAHLVRRMRANGLRTMDAYWALLDSGAGIAEKRELRNLLTVNLTWFFREAAALQRLVAHVSPDAAHRAVRVWSAGVSTGEEVWSLAMLFRDALGPRATRVRILATDLDTASLGIAQAGVYADLSKVAAPLRARHFVSVHEGWRVHPELRTMVQFTWHNLDQTPYPVKGGLDAIVCRNVLLYFSADSRHRILRAMLARLRPGGLLCVGASESLLHQKLPVVSVGPGCYASTAEDR